MEVPLVLVVAMATRAFSMDSAAGHLVSSWEGKYITPYDKYPIYFIELVDFFRKIRVALKSILFKFQQIPSIIMEVIPKTHYSRVFAQVVV